ncbi:MAG: YbhB/YbcL family Raf kinase inhibitor-like protein [Patescibacteria group bacterium]|jgi:hypothetical protein
MKLVSSEFESCEYIPSQYTCDGENTNPPLEICDVPSEAVSLALIMDDSDAPSGTFTHWTVWNIPPGIKEIDSDNCQPIGAVCGMTSFGKTGYGGPCPPSGEHRYFFKLYALDILLDLPKTATKKDLDRAIQGHIVDKCELIGIYGRK